MSKFEGNFNVYMKIARKLAFRLPQAKDRVKALRWIKKIFEAKQVEENTRFHALHLLLICLQRKKLVSPFSENPSKNKMLASYNWTRQQHDIARDILSKELCGNSQPPINFEVSNNFCDLLSYQEIPRFGVQFFYASSPYEITKWHKLKKSIIPRSLLNKSISSNINKSSEHLFGSVTQEAHIPRQETEEDVTFPANLKAKCKSKSRNESKIKSLRVEDTIQLEDEVFNGNNTIKANAQNESPRKIEKSYSKGGMNLSISKNDLLVQMPRRLGKDLLKKIVPMKYEKSLRQNWTASKTPEIFRKHAKRPFRKYELEEFLLPKDEPFRLAKEVFEGLEYELPEQKRFSAIKNELFYSKHKTSGSNQRTRKDLKRMLQSATISDDEVEMSWNKAYQEMMYRRQKQQNNKLEIHLSKAHTKKSLSKGSQPEMVVVSKSNNLLNLKCRLNLLNESCVRPDFETRDDIIGKPISESLSSITFKSFLCESEMDNLFDESLVAKYLPEWTSSRAHKQISVDKEQKENIFENLQFIGDTSIPDGINTTLQSFPTQSEKLIYDESAPEDINSLNFPRITTNPSHLETSRLNASLEESRIKQIRNRLQELQSKMKRASYTLLEDEQRSVIDANERTHTSSPGEVEPSFVTIPHIKQTQKFEIQPSGGVQTGVSILSYKEMEDLFEEGDVASPGVFKIQGLEDLPKELLHDVSYPHMYTTGTSTYPNLGDESMPEYISDSNVTVAPLSARDKQSLSPTSVKDYTPHRIRRLKYFKFVDNLQESNRYTDRISILHESEMDDLFDESLVAKYLPEWTSSRAHNQISVDKKQKEDIFENLQFIGDTSFPDGINTTLQSFPTQSEKLIYDEFAPEDINSLNFPRITTNPSHLETSKLKASLEESRIKQIRNRLQELQSKMKRASYTLLEDEQRTVIDANERTHTSSPGEVEPSFVTIPYIKQTQKFEIQPSESVGTGVSILSDKEMEDLFEEGDVASPGVFKIQGLENLPKELLHDVSYPHMYTTGTSTYPNLGDESMPEYISDSNVTVAPLSARDEQSLRPTSVKDYTPDKLQESRRYNDRISILHESEMDDLFDESLVAKYLPEWTSSRAHKQISVGKEQKEGIFENLQFIGDTSFPDGINTTLQSFPTQSEKLIYDESAPEDINFLYFSRITTNPSHLETSRLKASLEKSRIKQIRNRLQELQSKMKRASYTLLEDEQRTVIDANEMTHTSSPGEVEPSFVTIPYIKQTQKFEIQPSESVGTGVSILSDKEMEDLFEEGDVASPGVFKIQGLENLPKELLHDVSYPHMYTTGTSTYPNLGDESMPEYISDSNVTVAPLSARDKQSLRPTSVKDYTPDKLQESRRYNARISILHESEMDDLFDESLVAKYLPEWTSSRAHKQISVGKEQREGIFENLQFICDTSFPDGINTTLQSFPTQSEKLIYDESAPEDINFLYFPRITTNPSHLETSRLKASLEKSRIKQIRNRLQELQSKMKRASYTLLEDEQRTVIDANERTHTSSPREVEPSFVTIPYIKQTQKFEIQPSESVGTGVSILSDKEMEDLFEEGDVASPGVFKIQGLENLPKELLHDVSYPHMYTTGTSTYPNLGNESMPEYISDSNVTVAPLSARDKQSLSPTSVKDYTPHRIRRLKYFKFVDNLQESNRYTDRISILHESEMDDLFDESLVAKYLPEWTSSRAHNQISVDKEQKEDIFENLQFIGDTSFPDGINTTLQSFPTQSEKLIYDESAPEDINSLNFPRITTNPSHLETSKLKASLEESRIKQIRNRLQELQSKMKRASYTLLEDEQRTVIDANERTHTSSPREVEPSFVTIPYIKQTQKFEIQPSESVGTGVSILSDKEMEDLFEEGDVASPGVFKIQGLENLPKELLHDVSYPHMYTTGTSTYPNLGDESMPEYISDSNVTVAPLSARDKQSLRPTSVKDYTPHSTGRSKYFKFVDNLQESSRYNDRISILHESEMDDLFDESLVAKYLPEWTSSRAHKQISVDKEQKEGIFENFQFIGYTSFPDGINTTLQSFPTQSEKFIYDESAPEGMSSSNFSKTRTRNSSYGSTPKSETFLQKSRIEQIRKRLEELKNYMMLESCTFLKDKQRTVMNARGNVHQSSRIVLQIDESNGPPNLQTLPKVVQFAEVAPSILRHATSEEQTEFAEKITAETRSVPDWSPIGRTDVLPHEEGFKWLDNYMPFIDQIHQHEKFPSRVSVARSSAKSRIPKMKSDSKLRSSQPIHKMQLQKLRRPAILKQQQNITTTKLNGHGEKRKQGTLRRTFHNHN